MNSPKEEEAETGADFVCGGNAPCNKLSCCSGWEVQGPTLASLDDFDKSFLPMTAKRASRISLVKSICRFLRIKRKNWPFLYSAVDK